MPRVKNPMSCYRRSRSMSKRLETSFRNTKRRRLLWQIPTKQMWKPGHWSYKHRFDVNSSQAQKDRDADIAKLLLEQAATIKVEMEEKLAELQKSNEQEKASLTETHQQLIDSLQDHGSPGQFWEQEIQSLHFVIEMKSELIREQDKRLRSHKSTMERNLVLEERSRTLQQENEALKVQTQKQGAVTVRLSEELLSTQATLEKQIHLREKLEREKEQNLYRAVNGDIPQQFSLQSNAQELPVMVL
ncbi:hypothetical protein XENTR_v10007893 [Xenopus tropicalis]|nr:hypothetical protein XENTR_v10007893 [Xenopus tropicalis]